MRREMAELAGLEEIVRLAPDCEPGTLPPFGRLYPDAGDEFLRLARPRVGRFAVPESVAAG